MCRLPEEGLLSNVVMKIVPSEQMEGVWIVTGCRSNGRKRLERLNMLLVDNME